jgi:hypothetical protein
MSIVRDFKNVSEKLDLFPSSGELGDTPLGCLERVNFSHQTMNKVLKTPVILSVIHRRQNPLESTQW